MSPISAIVDMARTMANVTGSATTTVIVATREGAIEEPVQAAS
ncbi:dicarboxylate/amino acid:cation symporter [Erysipelothrix sp. D19-032]